jgi:23S rRNA (uracil1939-C5)-methyltransferase
VLPNLDLKPDVAVVDPPRTGMESHALQSLISMQPETIAYVSCDPATLALDCRVLLASGYELTVVQPFDQFPQTFHVETIVLMTRGSQND